MRLAAARHAGYADGPLVRVSQDGVDLVQLVFSAFEVFVFLQRERFHEGCVFDEKV